jgi:hypothetical protein
MVALAGGITQGKWKEDNPLFVGDQSFARKKNQDAQTDGQLVIKSSFIQSSDSIVSI